MEIDPLNRSVRLSVRELAVFRNRPISQGHGYSPWRAAVGQEWHKASEAETRAEHPDAQFEQSVRATWRHRDWNFELNGRIDQILPEEGGFLIREVKTIRSPLPAPTESLLEIYRDYFAQVSIYQAVLSLLPEYHSTTLDCEVQFINIENGARQSVSLEAKDLALFEDQLDALISFLDARRNSQLRLGGASLRPAFESLRPGQAELFEQLRESALQSRIILLQAPTGFGKTGIVLEHALTHMQSGLYERCIYLSSKSTGQLETIRQLNEMTQGQVHYLQMRNRTEHRIDAAKHSCTGDIRCDEALGQLWREADLRPASLFQKGTIEIETVKQLGAETGLCPYAITKACLPFADLWIGDSNYIFSPDSQSVFLEALGFNPERTLLIVDEAHNLPERTASSLSLELASGDLLFAIEELRTHGAPRRLLSFANELCRWIDALPVDQALNSSELYMGQDLCEDFSKQLEGAAFDYESTAPFALDLVWSIPRWADALASAPHEYLHWKTRADELRATCLNSSQWIRHCVAPFGGTILMSATLEPLDAFEESCGLVHQSATHAIGHAPWREGAYDVAIDLRVDTRYRARHAYYETTARTVASCIQANPGVPVAVFFSSYQYAQNVRTYLEAIAPETRIQTQPRGVNLAEQQNFIEESLLLADALFLILGSSYAEGIDQLGGRVRQIMVVGPALPEVNLVQRTRIEQHAGLSREEAFRDVYIRPAMRRIHQALGRIVRAPGHTAKVLLHGRRFADPAYFDELAPEYQTELQLENEAAITEWLNHT